MKKYLELLKKIAWYVGSFAIVCLFLSIIYYYFNISLKLVSTILLLFMIGCFFLTGFKGGKKCESKGFLYGIKTGAIFICVLYVLGGFFFSFKLSLYKIAYYLILLLSCTLGSMFGINTKK